MPDTRPQESEQTEQTALTRRALIKSVAAGSAMGLASAPHGPAHAVAHAAGPGQTPAYTVTAADRHALPAAYEKEARYIGYHDTERSRPFAHYFTDQLRATQPQLQQAQQAGRQPASSAYGVEEAARRLSRPGYDGMETGWAFFGDGHLLVSCLTDMPGVTAAMWDWWFGWHSTDSARYKLWHPRAHLFAKLGENRSGLLGLTDRQRYVGNVSYVDEYIGPTLNRLAIRFVDAVGFGFADRAGTTNICARVSASHLPVAAGWLIHQVRPTAAGSEMRSRFFLGYPEVLPLPSEAVGHSFVSSVLTSTIGKRMLEPVIASRLKGELNDGTANHLLQHCAEEMNHLAGFLPRLYEEFRDVP